MDTRTLVEPQLHAGDRVQLIRPIAGVAVGTQGTILRRFAFDPFSDICFDGYAAPRLVNTRDLSPAPADTAAT